jgi:hypothetical protein
MNIDISKGDLAEHLWLQRMLEARLHTETLRRAIEAGRVPPETGELWCFEVHANYSANAAEVTYVDKLSVRRCETYTLAEVLRLAMTDTP